MSRFLPALLWLGIAFSCSVVPLAGLAVADELAATDEEAPSRQQLEYFERHVRPLLVEHCYECHSGKSAPLQAALRVDHRSGLLAGGDAGPAIVPGDADGSLLVEAIRYESYEMPPQGKLADDQIDLLVGWINDGAVWPDEPLPEVAAPATSFDINQRRSDHWAWQPIAKVTPPEVRQNDWPRSALDHFILHPLEQAGHLPAAAVDRRTLIRRLAFDLVGLPPTPQQVDNFLSDTSPQAVQRLVDSLLQSPQFGERWGRHWLDLVRYAESRGHEFDHDAPNAFQYRDYVIRALNADVPYDQWVAEHIAGDLLSNPRIDPQHGSNESILGTGFWFLGEWVHSPVDIRKDEADRFDNMIDVMSKTFLGMTVACARCHDHKFDAISTADYYSLAGFLQSSDYRQVRFESIEHNRQIAAELSQLDRRFRKRIDKALATAAKEHSIAESAGLGSPPDADATTHRGSDRAEQENEPHILVDYSKLTADDYLQDGFLFGDAPRRSGQWVVEPDDDRPRLSVARDSAATTDRFWFGLKSHFGESVRRNDRLSSIPMSGRTLRIPTATLTAGRVACRVRGQGSIVACVDSHRLVAGPLHGETVKRFETKDQWRWVTMDLDRYVGHRLHLEFIPDEDSPLAVAVVTQGATPEQLTELEQRQAGQAQAADRLAARLDSVIGDTTSTAAEIRGLVAQWSHQRESLRQRVRTESSLAMAMCDGSGEDDHILIRGNAAQPGERVPRRFLSAIDGDQPLPLATRSGRLELAERINAPTNPLTHRVIVNRIWHHLMGRGIVPTTDDFGVLGQPPTHPQLLDHLADHFLRNGRSIKRTIRYIVLSRTYRMSSQLDADAQQQDPKNLLWHHRPPKRLEGEAIRDAILALSGRLDSRMHGQSVPVHLSSFMEGRGRPAQSGPLDGHGRRSLYLAVRRNFLSPFMLAFDTPVPFSTMGRRNVSNVPAQALILMNDPLVTEQARHWAERILRQRPIEPLAKPDAATVTRARIEAMYQSAFARPPSEAELRAAVAFVTRRADVPAAGEEGVVDDQAQVARWADLAHVLINTKEFVFLR